LSLNTKQFRRFKSAGSTFIDLEGTEQKTPTGVKWQIPRHVPHFVREQLAGVDPSAKQISFLEYEEENGRFIERKIPKSELTTLSGVAPRDLRKVLSLSSRRLISGIKTHSQCVIVHLDHVKALIMKDRFMLFNHAREERVQAFAQYLPSTLRQQKNHGLPIPFEFRVLEQILIEVTESLDSQLKELEPQLTALLAELMKTQTAANLTALVTGQDQLTEFSAAAQSLRNALTELLHNDEDLAELYLTEKRAIEDHMEAETLLENYLMQVEETCERVAQLQQRFKNSYNYVQIHFDSQRNRLMRMNLVVSMGGMSVATTAMGASIFGMNLLSGYETSPMMFYAVSGSLTGLGATVFGVMFWYYKHTKKMDLKLQQVANTLTKTRLNEAMEESAVERDTDIRDEIVNLQYGKR